MPQNALNQLGVFELTVEIGILGLNQLIELGRWLELAQNEIEEWQTGFRASPRYFDQFYGTPRLAPSLICKGEVELFGQSMPRFAIRLCMNGEKGFVNVRRLGTLGGQLSLSKTVDRTVVDLVKEAPCIADSFLKPPARYDANWHILSSPLAKVNCELEHGVDDVCYTPWVKHMKPGGGMCAQAACYMATCLHDKQLPRLHGLPEITYIATKNAGMSPKELRFDGLVTEEIANYFNSPEIKTLRAEWEGAKIPPVPGGVPPDILSDPDSGLAQDFELALRSYVLSNMPIIVPVDVGRMQGLSSGAAIKYKHPYMNGRVDEFELSDSLSHRGASKSIFRRNGIIFNRTEFSTIENLSHVVLAVGCKKPAPYDNVFSMGHGHPTYVKEPTLFSFNDPAHFPFMQATAYEMLLATSYSDDKNFDTLTLGWYLPVTPRPVKMPFLDEAQADNAGIKSISTLLKLIKVKLAEEIVIERPILRITKDPPHFRLIRARKSEIVEVLRERNFLEGNVKEITSHYQRLLSAFPDEADEHWCWIELDGSSILIWDAQKSLTKREVATLGQQEFEAHGNPELMKALHVGVARIASQLVLAVCIRKGYSIKTFCNFGACISAQKALQPVRIKGLLQAALISSYEALRDRVKVEAEEDEVPIELYVFMQPMMEKLLSPGRERFARKWTRLRNRVRFAFGRPFERCCIDRTCGLALMAAAIDDEKKIKRVANYFLRLKKRMPALATYLPGLSSGPNNNNLADLKPNPSLQALRFILRVLKTVRSIDPEKSPSILELVGGSRLLGRTDRAISAEKIVPGIPSSPAAKQLFVRCIEEYASIDNIFLALTALLPDIEAAQTKLAFELEPSSLIALGSLESINYFSQRLSGLLLTDKRWRWVGLNLDIPHYSFIAGHTPDDLSQSVKDLIVHSHISIHGFGHFADGILEELDTPETARQKNTCLAWLMLVESLVEREQHSGFVSLELECAKTRSQVADSLENLRAWLKP